MADTPSFNSQAEGIGHAVADKKPIIPIRQRAYAWTKDEVKELFEDIAGAIDRGKPDYFLGFLVATRRDSSTRPEVVDGQQRLATCVMLLAAIRDYFHNTHGPQSKDAIKYEQEFLVDYDDKTKTEVPHLKLNIEDGEFFLDYVLRSPSDPARIKINAAEAKKPTRSKRPSHRLIQDAAQMARDRVKKIVGNNPADSRDVLVKWVDFIRTHAKILWFEVPDHSSAYTIFETLNDRGLDLSKSDLLKNYLFGHAGDRFEEIHQPWSKMVGAIETVTRKDIAATFVRHYWISTHGPVRERQLFKEIKDEIQSADAAISLANSLEGHAALYAALLSSDHELWSGYGEEAKETIRHLVMLQAERIRPLLLAVVKNFRRDEVKKALRLFENWTVRLVVSSRLGGVLEATIGELAKEVSDKTLATAKALSSHKKVASAIPGDTEFQALFSVARASKHELARYYLLEMEDHSKRVQAGGEPTQRANRKETVTTLEHVLPEHPSTEWGFVTQEARDEASDNVTRIGNMLLLRKGVNEEAANLTLPKKLPFYRQERTLLLTKRFVSEYAGRTKWGKQQIDERQKELAKLAVKTWPLKV